jgi:hypothetical protein
MHYEITSMNAPTKPKIVAAVRYILTIMQRLFECSTANTALKIINGMTTAITVPKVPANKFQFGFGKNNENNDDRQYP